MITAFDLDGVLSRADTMATLVLTRLRGRPWLMLPVAVLAIVAAAARADGDLRPRCNRAIVHTALSGMTETGYLRLAADVAENLAARPGNRDPAIIARLREAIDRGGGLVTTATERRLASFYLAAIGCADVTLHASTFVFDRRGPRFRTHNVGERKATAVRRAFPQAAIDVLYTDSASDVFLTRLSRETVLVAPSPRSTRILERQGVPFRVL